MRLVAALSPAASSVMDAFPRVLALATCAVLYGSLAAPPAATADDPTQQWLLEFLNTRDPDLVFGVQIVARGFEVGQHWLRVASSDFKSFGDRSRMTLRFLADKRSDGDVVCTFGYDVSVSSG